MLTPILSGIFRIWFSFLDWIGYVGEWLGLEEAYKASEKRCERVRRGLRSRPRYRKWLDKG